MPEPKRRGRPAKEPADRKVNRSIRLAPATWGQADQLSRWWGVPAAQVIERLIEQAVADAHGDEARFQADPDFTPEEKAPTGRVPSM